MSGDTVCLLRQEVMRCCNLLSTEMSTKQKTKQLVRHIWQHAESRDKGRGRCCAGFLGGGYSEVGSPVTSGVWNWSPSGPPIRGRGCATSGTGAPRPEGPVPSRRRPRRATRPGGSGARPCSLSTTARIVSTPPWRGSGDPLLTK